MGVSRVTRRWRRAGLTVAFLMAFVTMAAPPASATDDLCGSSISSDLKLDHDLSCSGDGLIVASDGVTIKLNGHMVMGSGTDPESEGIRIVGRSGVSILGPGTITKFRTGVLVNGSTDIVVKRIHALENGLMSLTGPPFPLSPNDGIFVTMSSNVELRKNLVKGNGDDGINIHMSSEVRVVKNEVDDNNHDGIRLDLADGNVLAENSVLSHDSVFGGSPVGCGIELFGSKDNKIEENRLVANTNGIRLRMIGTSGPASTGNEVEENTVDGTGAEMDARRGIHVRDVSTGNEIEENRVTNYWAGIRLGDSGTPVGNTFEENRLRRNVCAVNGTTAGNTFDDNKFRDNGADFCPPLPPGYLQTKEVFIEVETEEGGLELDVEIQVDGRIPRDGSGGAFGYAVLTGGFDNVLVLVTHLGIDDSEFEDPVTGFHTHVLDLMTPTSSCGGFDAEVDIPASMANAAFDPDYRFKVRGEKATIRNVPASDLADAGVETVASFTVTPVFAAGALTNLCVDVVDNS
jgi:parallel beta-helix repeat protein